MSVKVYVLVVTEPGRTGAVKKALLEIDTLVEIQEVMGPYDIVVVLEAENLPEVPPILGGRIRNIEGIESTTSLVTLPN